MASHSYPSLVLAGLLGEPEFFGFLATYAVPDDRVNPAKVLRERWAESARAFAACPDHAALPLAGWDPAWGDPSRLADRPGLEALRRHHPDLAFAAAPLAGLVVVHPSLDLEQAAFWASRLGDAGALAVPPRNEASVSCRLGEGAQHLEVNAAFALLGAYLSVGGEQGAALPQVGVHWQPGINVLQVGRLAGRLVLVNGHHRAFALARAGHSHVPCVCYALDDLEAVGISAGGRAEATLLAPRPPRIEHFLDPVLAVPVLLRRSTRVVRIAVSERTIQER